MCIITKLNALITFPNALTTFFGELQRANRLLTVDIEPSSFHFHSIPSPFVIYKVDFDWKLNYGFIFGLGNDIVDDG